MFWDKISFIYDFFESAANSKVYKSLGTRTAYYINKNDTVLECACGTGAISRAVAAKCRKLVAVDLSSKMMKQAEKKCKKYGNAIFRKADITKLNCRDGRFDKVIAGNVIHLLDEPEKAVREMMRVCKKGGNVIIPTYINDSTRVSKTLVKIIEKAGLTFKREFDLESYMEFFRDMDIKDVDFFVIDGRMPCAVAVITV